jgi:HK97 gp10 family phage protein
MQMVFEGGKELEAALLELGGAALAKATARRALKKAAEPILKNYQGNTVVKTGRLLGSEIIGVKLNKRQASMNRKMGKAEVEVHIGTADPAGIQEEFGNIHQPAHPALRPAWDAEGGQVAIDRVGKEMWDDYRKTAARLAKRNA